MNTAYQLVQLKNGSFSIRSLVDGETFHPIEGPIAEADALYVRQLKLSERLKESSRSASAEDFVIWDVGLGAGGNALAALRCLSGIRARVHIASFDRTLSAFQFARRHAIDLRFPAGFETQIDEMLAHQRCVFRHGELAVHWTIHLGDFCQLVAGGPQLPHPHAIFFDAFSPARNPEMWTLSLFKNLFRCLDRRKVCALATFSRSTAARVAMLLGGFFVGVGEAIAGKEETTIAADTLGLIDRPLDSKWLRRAKISRNAEPLHEPRYSQQPLSPETWEHLRAHPQFA